MFDDLRIQDILFMTSSPSEQVSLGFPSAEKVIKYIIIMLGFTTKSWDDSVYNDILRRIFYLS